jgi:hypothetical protein
MIVGADSSVGKCQVKSITELYHQSILVATHELDRRSDRISRQIKPKVWGHLITRLAAQKEAPEIPGGFFFIRANVRLLLSNHR